MKEQLMSMLEALAQTLGTTTELLWDVLVKQAVVEAQIWVIWGVVWVVVWGIMALSSAATALIGRKQEWELWGCWFTLTVFAVFMGSVCVIECYSGYLTVSQNPEFWALNEILNTIGR